MLFKDRLANVPGLKVEWGWTCCGPRQEPKFRALLERAKPRIVLEIGTAQGLSAALLAEYAKRVVTVDCEFSADRVTVWTALGVADRIESYRAASSRARDAFITDAARNADLAFIDGGHLMPDVVRDFNLVAAAGCRRMLFHDYWGSPEAWPDVCEFIDGLDRNLYAVEILKPFAYVEVR